MIVGPRAAGKTTTARRHVKTTVQLDREAEAVAFRADPDAALRVLEEPILLDEWQAVPGVLGAVKRAVDASSGAGRFLLTGSVVAHLEREVWPGTGRVVSLPMYGLSIREQRGATGARPLLDRLADGEELPLPTDPPDLPGYIELALQGGFPEPLLALPRSRRHVWLDGYTEQLILRDVAALEGGRDPVRLRRYLETYALNTAGIVDETTLFTAAGINRKTATAYERLLTNLMVIESLPAWTTNRLKRLSLRPKRYVVDPGIGGALLHLDVTAVMRDGDLLGRLLDTFVVAQMRAELAVCSTHPRLYHLRDEHGRHEIDVVAELGASRVVGMEIKAHSAPAADAARHLIWLRDRLGDRFARGVVFHTGPNVYRLGDRIVAVPICALWPE